MTIEEYNSEVRKIASEYAELGAETNAYLRRLAAIDLVVSTALALAAAVLGNSFIMIGVPVVLYNAFTSVRDGRRAFNDCMRRRQDTLEKLKRSLP